MENKGKNNAIEIPETCQNCGCCVPMKDTVYCTNTYGCPYDVIDNDHWL